MVPEVIFDERISLASRWDDRRPAVCALISLALRQLGVLCRLGVRKMAPDCPIGSALVTILRRSPEILVVLFIYFGLATPAYAVRTGFNSSISAYADPGKWRLRTLTSVHPVRGVLRCPLYAPMRRRRYAAR